MRPSAVPEMSLAVCRQASPELGCFQMKTAAPCGVGNTYIYVYGERERERERHEALSVGNTYRGMRP
jgi:hypothetical protein